MKYIVLLAVVFVVSACGVKPGSLDAPSGKQTDFPRTYPAPPPQ